MQFTRDDIVEGHPVTELIKNRLIRKDNVKDQAKLGIVIEGGGMRGVISAGAVLALEKMKSNFCFDAFYGTSAGAITAAYFAAEQASLGTSIFYDNLTSSKFISKRRMLHPRRAIMDLGYLGRVIDDRKKLHTERVLDKNFNAYALNIKTALVEKMEKANNRNELIQQLLASCTMPYVCHVKTPYKGKEYINGGLNTSVPWKEALADGCTHLVVLLTRPANSPRPSLRQIEKKLISNNLAKKNSDLIPLFLERAEAYNENILELRGRTGENILIIAPADNAVAPHSLDRNKRKIIEAGIAGSRAVYESFFLDSPDFTELIQPVNHGRLL